MLFNIQLQLFASKKGASSTKNGRGKSRQKLSIITNSNPFIMGYGQTFIPKLKS